jgi:hypothetical protein
MINLGVKIGNTESKVESRDHICYPSMSMSLKSMPFLKGKNIDDNIVITLKCKIKSINKYGDGDTTYGLDLIEGEKGKESK